MKHSAAAALASSLLFFAAHAQTDTAATYRKGDSWDFRTVTNGVEVESRERVVDTLDSAILLLRSELGAGGEPRRMRRSPAMNAFDRTGHEILQVQHPLEVGRSWAYRFEVNTPWGRTENTRTAKVTAREQVHTAAGTFDAYRIEADGYWTNFGDNSPAGGNGHIREISWYAPDAKRVVRYEGRSTQTRTAAGGVVTVWESRSELKQMKLGESTR